LRRSDQDTGSMEMTGLNQVGRHQMNREVAMSKESINRCLMLSFFLITLLVPAVGFAQEGKASVRLWGQMSPFISGEAGTGPGAPDYKDAFDTGWGLGGEFAWRFCRWFSGVAGLGYEVLGGDTYKGFSFDDLDMVPLYAGGKFHLIPGAAPWDLYLRLDVGAAYLSSVDIRYGSLNGRYWDASWVFLFDVGFGTEYRWGRWGLSLDLKAQYLGSPDSALGRPSEADAFWTVPITVGLNYHF
jgi:hypothetical protein